MPMRVFAAALCVMLNLAASESAVAGLGTSPGKTATGSKGKLKNAKPARARPHPALDGTSKEPSRR